MRTRILPYCIAVAVAGTALFSTGVAASPSVDAVSGAQSNDTSQSQAPASASSAATSAQLGTIIVTANKRSQALEDVPMAVTALPGYQLDRASAFSFADYASRVPGLNIISSGEGHTQLVLRGVTSGSTQPNATVGTYIDGVPYGSSTVYALGSILTPDIDPADLKRIEVLRGPQGTLYGSNTLGGLIKFVTTPPDTSHAAARVKVGYRSIEGGGAGFATHVMVNVPLKKNELGLRVNAYHRDDPGYIDNVATGQSDVNQAGVDGARAQLLWTPSDAFSARLWALAQNLDSDGLANQGVDVNAVTLKPIYGDLKRSHPPSTGLFKLQYRLYALSLNADLGWASLVSVSSYSTLRMNMVKDVTTAFGPILGPVLGVPGAGFSLHKPVSMDKYTQELRLQSSGERTLEWRAGIYYTHERSTNPQQVRVFDASTGVPIALPTISDQLVGPATFVEWAGYGDITWHATPRLSILLGARYSHDRTSYSQSGHGLLAGGSTHFSTRGSDHTVTYLFNPSYKFSDNLMAYVRIASGFRPGGPNAGVPPGLGAPVTFGPDKLVSYEAGFKSTFLDRRMSLDVAAYYIDWTQIQLTVTKGGFSFLGNAGEARSRGVELAWEYVPVSGLHVSLAGSWTDAELTADTPPGLYGYDGDRLPYVPRWNTNLSIDYDFPIGNGWSGYLGGGYSYVGERYGDFLSVPAPRTELAAYHRVDLRAGASRGRWTLGVYVKNLTDERGISSIAPETTVATASPFAATYIRPRTVGVSVSVDF